jgi:hypothetical protein
MAEKKIQEFTEKEWEADVEKNSDDYSHFWGEAEREMNTIRSSMISCDPDQYDKIFGVNVRKMTYSAGILKIVRQTWETDVYEITDLKESIKFKVRYNFTKSHLIALKRNGIRWVK